MIDLREYKNLLQKLVSKENEDDPNWKWSVKSISKNKAVIRWGYLDYLNEKNNGFIITVDTDTDLLGNMVTQRYPGGEWMHSIIVGGRYGDVPTPEEAIQWSVRHIAAYAHSRY